MYTPRVHVCAVAWGDQRHDHHTQDGGQARPRVGAGRSRIGRGRFRQDHMDQALVCYLPLATPISDAKVLTGRQKPMTEIAFLFAEISTADGHQGLGFSYSKRAGGPGQFAHAKEIAPAAASARTRATSASCGPSCVWAGASVGRSGLAMQAIAAFDVALWDLKARRAGLPLAKLLGAQRDSVQLLQHLGRLPAHAARAGAGERRRLARARHRRHQAQGRPARPRDRHRSA